MERLSHDLNRALEESSCSRAGSKKFGLRRRTRSAGNLPASCLNDVNEDETSSSPPQVAIISQVLSDSDDPQVNICQGNSKNRVSHFCPGGNFESDSFNENFSPAKPPNARRKRKFKKMAIDYTDNCNNQSTPSLLLGQAQVNLVPNCSVIDIPNSSPFTSISKKKRIFKHSCPDRSNVFCGKRKWSHRERSDIGEMRERSFSGGCASKSYFCGKSTSKSFLDFKNAKKFLPIDKVPKYKDKHVKSIVSKSGLESALQNITLTSISSTPTLPGSSSFNFVYRNPLKTVEAPLFSKTETSVFSFPFNAPENDGSKTKKHEKSHRRKHKGHKNMNQTQLRNPLQFDDANVEMDCTGNNVLSSSSISSSDSEGVVTNDSDREGDDELTDWPGNDESSKGNAKGWPIKAQNQQNQKLAIKKDKFLPKQGLSSCKNRTDTKIADSKDMQLMDDDTMMSDSGSVLDIVHGSIYSLNRDSSSTLTKPFTSFADVKNAGLSNNNINEAFFQSFQGFSDQLKSDDQYTPRTNFSLQKTSSSDLNLSEKSPQSDHCYSEHSLCFPPPAIREIRAGCRRLHDERPGFAILSAANEQLSKFLQDSCQDELKLSCIGNDQEEKEKLASLAKLYSLDMSVELGRPILRKTSNTMQSIRVEHTRFRRQNFVSEFKRRCYGPDFTFSEMSQPSIDLTKKSISNDVCGGHSSTSNIAAYSHEPFVALAKASTMNDLSQSQDYDQGFSSLGNTPPLDGSDELKSRGKSDGGFSSDGS